jgi:hypothetical protein
MYAWVYVCVHVWRCACGGLYGVLGKLLGLKDMQACMHECMRVYMCGDLHAHISGHLRNELEDVHVCMHVRILHK